MVSIFGSFSRFSRYLWRLAEPRKIRLPSSAATRRQSTYVKLLKRIDPRSRSPFKWEGRFFRPGSSIEETELWPDGSFPRVPLLVEHAGAENPGRGWNRHKADNTVILWRYERPAGAFIEVARVQAPAGMWACLLEPLVRQAIAEDAGFTAPVDLEGIRARIAGVIAAEIDRVSDSDRARVLTLIHDELASRLADWGSAGTDGTFLGSGAPSRPV